MAITTGFDGIDSSLNIPKFYLGKITGQENIGARDLDGNPIEYYSSGDIGTLQSSAILQRFDTNEFRKPATQPNISWINFLNPISDSDTTKSVTYKVGSFEKTVTWTIGATDRDTEKNYVTKVLSHLDDVIVGTNTFGVVFFTKIRTDLTLASPSFGTNILGAKDLEDSLNDIKNQDSYLSETIGENTYFYKQDDDNNLFNALNSIYASSYDGGKDIIYNKGFPDFQSFYVAFDDFKNTINISVAPIFEDKLRYLNQLQSSTPYTNIMSGVIGNHQILSGLNLTGLYSQVTGGQFNNGDIVSVTPEGLEFIPPSPAAFTGLLDTPDGNIVPSGFVRGDKDGLALEYSDIHFLSGDIKDIPAPINLPPGSGYLYADWKNKDANGNPAISWQAGTNGNTPVTIQGATFLTGLFDTPSVNSKDSILVNNGVQFLYKNLNNDKLVAFTGLSDTPDAFSAGKFMRSSANSIEFVDAPASGITGLIDTPNNFTNASGKYLRVNDASNAVEFIDISGEISSQEIGWNYYTRFGDLPPSFEHAGMFAYVAQGKNISGAYVSASDKWVKIGSDGEAGSSTFTGLTDAPSSYTNASGKYLQVKDGEDGVEFSDPPVLNVTNIADLPANPASGRLATVGCDLYIGCNNQWQKFSTEGDDDPVPPAEGFPDCVNNITEQVLYNTYKQQYMDSYGKQMTDDAIRNGVITPTHEVCVHASNPNHTAIIESDTPEAKYKWGMFYGEQVTSISGSAGLPNTAFLRWRTFPVAAVNNITDPTNAVSEIIIDQSMDIYADFQGVSAGVITVPNGSVDAAPLRMAYSNNILVVGNFQKDQSSSKVYVFKVNADRSLNLKQTLNGGASFGIGISLSDSGELLAISDYTGGTQSVFLYKKGLDDTFTYDNKKIYLNYQSFSTALDWVGENALYTTSWFMKRVFAYDVDYATFTNTVYNQKSSLGELNAITDAPYGLGDSVSVLSDQTMMVVSSNNRVVICGRGSATDAWNFIIFDFFAALTNHGGHTPPPANTNPPNVGYVKVAIKDENTFYVSYIGTTINNLPNAGAVFKFEYLENAWTHTDTIVSDNPKTGSFFGIDLVIRDSQLFILEAVTYKIYVKDL